MYMEHLATGMLGVHKLMASIVLEGLGPSVGKQHKAPAANSGKPDPCGEAKARF
jgi:hypothetical protein